MKHFKTYRGGKPPKAADRTDAPEQPRSSRASMIAAGNPDVLKEAFTPRTINGLTPTQRGTKVWRDGVKAGTRVQHDPGKNDQAGLNRGKPITY